MNASLHAHPRPSVVAPRLDHPRRPREADRHLDGDTIEALGKRIRLVGFDAPELGGHAHCGLERMLAARATSRLRQMIRSNDDIDLQIVEAHAGRVPMGRWPAITKGLAGGRKGRR
jgi:endonuclease YncB( thermonuclease family)